MQRATRRIAIAVAYIYAACLLAANFLLNTSVAYFLANRQPEKFVAS